MITYYRALSVEVKRLPDGAVYFTFRDEQGGPVVVSLHAGPACYLATELKAFTHKPWSNGNVSEE